METQVERADNTVPGQSGAQHAQAGGGQGWTLLVKGFEPKEHQLLDGVVLLSRRRLPRVDLVNDPDATAADVVMIDGRDPAATEWAARQSWLANNAVIWVDAPAAPNGHLLVRRPVQWTSIPLLLARALEEGPRKTGNTQAAPSTSRAVLVVDDSLAARAHLRTILEERGYLVSEASSAEAGIAIAAQASYACVLMDVMMPGIDGYEACRRIKAGGGGRGPAPAVVMLTSKASPFDRLRGTVAGCDAYLTKPVNSDDLYATLSRYARDAASIRTTPSAVGTGT